MTKTDMEGLPSFWEAVSGGRAEARRRRLERRDRLMARLYVLLAALLVAVGLTVVCTPPLNQWLNDGRLTASARAVQAEADGFGHGARGGGGVQPAARGPAGADRRGRPRGRLARRGLP